VIKSEIFRKETPISLYTNSKNPLKNKNLNHTKKRRYHI
jgi:tRNA(Ser,Leu) C12 N-acetylase TAN1